MGKSKQAQNKTLFCTQAYKFFNQTKKKNTKFYLTVFAVGFRDNFRKQAANDFRFAVG